MWPSRLTFHKNSLDKLEKWLWREEKLQLHRIVGTLVPTLSQNWEFAMLYDLDWISFAQVQLTFIYNIRQTQLKPTQINSWHFIVDVGVISLFKKDH